MTVGMGVFMKFDGNMLSKCETAHGENEINEQKSQKDYFRSSLFS